MQATRTADENAVQSGARREHRRRSHAGGIVACLPTRVENVGVRRGFGRDRAEFDPPSAVRRAHIPQRWRRGRARAGRGPPSGREDPRPRAPDGRVALLRQNIHTAFLTAKRHFSHGVSNRAFSFLRSDIQFSVGPTVRTYSTNVPTL